jgi:2-C-methyl-D-erythritol 4-phosphate cytidylyltransferase
VRAGGASLVEHATRRVLGSGRIDLVVVVAPPGGVEAVRALVPDGVVVTAGAGSRQESVAAGLAALHRACAPGGALGREADAVLVHDAARCLAPEALVARVVDAVLAGHPVVVPVVPVHDTVREHADDRGGTVVVDRARLLAVQTPQGFARGVLERAHRGAGAEPAGAGAPATDDASLAERLGHPVHLVAGADEAFKVTRPLDLALVDAVLAGAALTSTGATGAVEGAGVGG